jgi:hypothetical protein
MEATDSSEVFIWLATITHDDLADPIRVASEVPGVVAYKNGAIVNYKYGSDVYLGCPFRLEFVTDNEQAPRGRVIVPDPTREIGIEILLLSSSPRISFRLVKLSDYTTTFGPDNERIPTGTPTSEVYVTGLFLRNVTGDALQVQADLTTWDISTEPWPKYRVTADRLPWVQR